MYWHWFHRRLYRTAGNCLEQFNMDSLQDRLQMLVYNLIYRTTRQGAAFETNPWFDNDQQSCWDVFLLRWFVYLVRYFSWLDREGLVSLYTCSAYVKCHPCSNFVWLSYDSQDLRLPLFDPPLVESKQPEMVFYLNCKISKLHQLLAGICKI